MISDSYLGTAQGNFVQYQSQQNRPTWLLPHRSYDRLQRERWAVSVGQRATSHFDRVPGALMTCSRGLLVARI